MKIAQDVLDALAQATTDGSALRLSGRIDPNLYTRCDKVLRAAGGQWSRRAQAHLFPQDPAPLLKQILATGQLAVPQDVGYFPTPLPVVRRLIELADLRAGLEVLEPSAGRGAIAHAAAAAGCLVDCVELLDDNVRALIESGTARTVTAGDFLGLDPEPAYDRVVMNPPFAHDLAHIAHARAFLKPDGLLVTVMSAGVTAHATQAARQFRAQVEDGGGQMEELPRGMFKDSGTMVRSLIAVLPGPRWAGSLPAPAAAPTASPPVEQLRPPLDIAQDIIVGLSKSLDVAVALRDKLRRRPAQR